MLTSALLAVTMAQTSLPALLPNGKNLVTPEGKVVTLKGCNLGNWLMIELWMLGIEGRCGVTDQASLFRTLDSRFGRKERDHLMEFYRQNWIAERDFAMIRSFGFNFVRLPMDYRLFEDDERPMKLKRDAFKWIDQTITWAKKHQLYVLLDMHGIQGGQSPYEHTGENDQNKYWTDKDAQKRAQWLWTIIAKRYKGESTVMGYDPMNEPYGGTHEGQLARFDELYKAIRKGDPAKLVYFHSHTDGFDHYLPVLKNYKNIGLQAHYYPGLFGGGEPNLRTHQRHFQKLTNEVVPKINKSNVPFLIGEMNVVFASAGGPEMMRRYFDFHASQGWATTSWSYKAASKDGGFGDAYWGMVTNPKPLGTVDFTQASAKEIEGWFRSLGRSKWDPEPTLKKLMSQPRIRIAALPELPKPPLNAPRDRGLQGWTSADLGGAKKGAVVPGKDGRFVVYGAGADIWGTRDEGRFVHQEVSGDFEVTVEVESLEDVAEYAKAGLMVRTGLAPDAGNLLLSTFASGELQVAFRKSDGASTEGLGGEPQAFPATIRISRRGDSFTCAVLRDGAWKAIKEVEWAGCPSELLVGVIALSHNPAFFTRAHYRGLSLTTK